MGDHFVLLVDHLLTESTLEAAIVGSRNLYKHTIPVTIDDDTINNSFSDCQASCSSSPRKLVECRICQDDDFDSNMEVPCSCSGSLKYAHRRCVQRWCNEKGDTTCEICHQPFKPGYTAPPPIFRIGGIQMNLRGNWQVTGRELNNPRIITVLSAANDQNVLHQDYDEYTVASPPSIFWFRLVAITFMVLLILRHTLPVMVNRAGDYSFPLIMLLILRVAGIVLSVCIILKAVTSIIHRRQRQAIASSDEEEGSLTLHRPHVIAVR